MPRIYSDAEFQHRLSTLRERMDRLGISAAVCTSVHNIVYLSGFWYVMPYGRYAAVVVPLKGEPVIITPAIEAGRVRDFTWFGDIRVYTDTENTMEGTVRLAKDVLQENGVSEGTIGVEEDSIPLALWKVLRDALPKASLVDVSDTIEAMRMVKSREEIDLTRQLAHMCDTAAAAVDQNIREGETEIEISHRAEAALCDEYSSRFPDFDYITGQIGARGGIRIWGHHGSTGRRLQKGDLIGLWANPIVMGYFSTIARKRFMGEIPAEVMRYHDIAMEAQDRCIEAVKPGVKFSQIDEVALKVFEKHGVAQHKGFGTGHSHGLMGPFWGREKKGEYRPYNDTVLKAGMITSMEPSLFIPGVGVLMLNDMILVTEDGSEVMTKYPRELRRIDG